MTEAFIPGVHRTLRSRASIQPRANHGGDSPGEAQTGAKLRTTALRLFLSCWLIYTLHFATNVVREIYPALSLGDHLSVDVSEYVGLHPDIFEISGRGAYINNNLGASILGAVPYALARPAIDFAVEQVRQRRATANAEPPEYQTVDPTQNANDREFFRRAYQRGLDVKFGLAAGVIQAFLMAPLSALSVVIMLYVMTALGLSVRSAVWLAVLYAFATPIFYRTAYLNQNLLVGHFAFFAFVLLWWPWPSQLPPQKLRWLLAGVLCGWTIVLDYSGLVPILVLSLYALACWRDLPQRMHRLDHLFLFGIGGLLSGGVLLGLQWQSFDNPFLPAQYYMPETQFSHLGYRGMDWPQLDLLWKTAFDVRFGLFTSAPLLVLALWVPGWWRRRGRIVADREVLCIVAYTLVFFLFASASQYGHLQFNTGVRYIVPVVPFLFLLVANVLLRMPILIAAMLSILSTYWSWCLAMYREVEYGLGIFEALIRVTFEGFQLPWMTTLARTGFLPDSVSALPLLLLTSAILAALWLLPLPIRVTADEHSALQGSPEKRMRHVRRTISGSTR